MKVLHSRGDETSEPSEETREAQARSADSGICRKNKQKAAASDPQSQTGANEESCLHKERQLD